MPSKQQNVDKPNISPVLFMAVDGEPMSFFLRPGPVKRKLQPLITAGGGMVCSVQQPGAILLIDQEERGSIPETTAHWYVSTQYIHDCVEKDEQLNLEDYRLNPEVPRHSAKLNSGKETSPGILGGRVAYTPEDDAAILSYISKHKAETGGNRLWQEMAKHGVTSHSWQSMKYRYRVRLAKKQAEAVEVATTAGDTEAAEGEIKVEEKGKETEAEKPSSAEDDASPQTHSAKSDPAQVDAQSISAESTQPKIIEAQAPISPQGEAQHETPQTDNQPAESSQVETLEAEISNSPQPEGPCLDPQTDADPVLAESSESETEEPQTVSSPKESVPENSPPVQPKVLSDSPSQKKTKEEEKLEQPRRQLTRRQLQLEEVTSPGPYSKKLRSSSTSVEQLSSSLQPLKKTKSAIRSAPQKDTMVDPPPSKRARGETVAAEAESQQEERGQAAVSETSDPEFNSMPQKEEKKKQKRKLGILELAAKEFEEDSESNQDEAPVPPNPTETVTMQPTSPESPRPPSRTADDAAPTQSSPEHGPRLQEKAQETQASSGTCPPETSCRQPAATEAVSTTCKAHLFIFDSESQEEDSQSIAGANTAAAANRQPAVNTDSAFSLTQVQLEEDKRRITELMNQTNQDLVSVTKALLKTSGDFSAALDLLLNPLSISGPFWGRCDDSLLLSADPVVRQQLQEKYGEENVAKRIVFLEAEG